MPRYALSVEIAGGAFHGTQVQARHRTVVAVLQEALQAIDPAWQSLTPCGRLDAGVDARCWVAHGDSGRNWQPPALISAVNSQLPPDLAVIRAAPVADDWHARYAPHDSTYSYRLLVSPVRPVLDHGHWWLRRLDHPDLLECCAAWLPGAHDLRAFAARRGDASDQADGRRHYHQATWTSDSDPRPATRYTFTITGDGFLYRQVRGLVGAMVAVARGTVAAQTFHHAIDHPSAARIGSIAPAVGLCLDHIRYHNEPDWQTPSAPRR